MIHFYNPYESQIKKAYQFVVESYQFGDHVPYSMTASKVHGVLPFSSLRMLWYLLSSYAYQTPDTVESPNWMRAPQPKDLGASEQTARPQSSVFILTALQAWQSSARAWSVQLNWLMDIRADARSSDEIIGGVMRTVSLEILCSKRREKRRIPVRLPFTIENVLYVRPREAYAAQRDPNLRVHRKELRTGHIIDYNPHGFFGLEQYVEVGAERLLNTMTPKLREA
ncbi:hypothetical protein BDV93DRAFT_506669 [Ceratobasidium sp. AG-I]|nr:hypothetical protein BDV93DRAFT_506669 [Ceratobasidium sp. AG-I]